MKEHWTRERATLEAELGRWARTRRPVRNVRLMYDPRRHPSTPWGVIFENDGRSIAETIRALQDAGEW